MIFNSYFIFFIFFIIYVLFINLNFLFLNRLILEDRRIRMNSWVAKLIHKPIERFKNPKLINPLIPKHERSNFLSINFTIPRKYPLTNTFKKKPISFVLLFLLLKFINFVNFFKFNLLYFVDTIRLWKINNWQDKTLIQRRENSII